MRISHRGAGPATLLRVHGNNERISAENVRRGTAMLLEIVQAVVGKPGSR
jgi:acetylornithine deacetylase/succinyl-diaminopimelate desuccinylase-like protein